MLFAAGIVAGKAVIALSLSINHSLCHLDTVDENAKIVSIKINPYIITSTIAAACRPGLMDS
jgi:hypothetical protein